MRRFVIVAAVASLIALVPARASAQAYFAPFFAYDFGGDAGNCASLLSDCAEKRSAYGVAIGALSHGIIGFEEDISYAPDFFGKSTAAGSNSVLTLMSNLILSVPAGGFHPYVSGGIGLVRTKLNEGGVLDFSNTGFGYNVGGGVMAMLPKHLGFRVDLRHIRSTSELSVAGFNILQQGTKLNFSRISFALVLH